MNLPLFGWFGIIAALFYIAAIIVITVKGLVKPKFRVKIHRALAGIGLLFMLLHAVIALSYYF
jgi:hypothetical protein